MKLRVRLTAASYHILGRMTLSCAKNSGMRNLLPDRRQNVERLERSYKIRTSTEATYNLTDVVAFTIQVRLGSKKALDRAVNVFKAAP